jgi:hypothetical protein
MLVIFCDLQKAFDCVNLDIRLLRMKFFGILHEADKAITIFLNISHSVRHY